MSLRGPSVERRRGVVIILALLGLILMTALVLFTLNLGTQVDRRVEAQTSADAAVQGAATWTARSMNQVAMNNIDMAQTIALINVLDAMPQAVANVYNEAKAFRDRLEQQLQTGLGGGPGALNGPVTEQYQLLLDQLIETYNQAKPPYDMFVNIDTDAITHYDRDGALWKKMRAEDELNQALVEGLRLRMIEGGIDAGEAAIARRDGDEDNAVVILPVDAPLPIERGHFNDFRRPTVNGILPDDIADDATNRGPFDTVFGWRRLSSEITGGEYTPGDSSGSGTGRPTAPIGRRATDSGGTVTGGSTTVISYRVYGPRDDYLDRVRNFNIQYMPLTRLYNWVHDISEIKLNKLWPNVTRYYNDTHNVDWITDYEQAKQIAYSWKATHHLPRVLQTAFFVVEIKSRFKDGEAGFGTPGSFTPVLGTPRIAFYAPFNGPQPHGYSYRPDRYPGDPDMTRGVGGWGDPDMWGLQRLTNYVWLDAWSDPAVLWDLSIGINPETDSAGQPIPHTVYHYDYYIFAGANTAWGETPSNPFDGFDPNSPAAPAPMNFTPGSLAYDDPAQRWRYLNFLAAVRASDDVPGWPSRFNGGRPASGLYAVAQAKVFNNHSWDLWTPMWRAQLTLVRGPDNQPDLAAWASAAASGSPPPGISARDLADLATYLQNVGPLAPVMLSH
ncbi:MAG: pilus assembly protein TadG-related protein [Phycisphaerales bacterium]